MPEQVQRYRRRLTAQQKDERQDDHDRRRLAHQHPSDLLCSLTRGWDRRRRAQCRLNRVSSFAISSYRTLHVLGVRHMMHMRTPSHTLRPCIFSLASPPTSLLS